MKKYFKLFLAALLAVTMAVFVAACDGTDDGSDDKNATNVSGKTYVYVDGTVSGTDQVTNADLNQTYKDVTITFNADGTAVSDILFDATWTQSGANVSITMTVSGMGSITYNCKATGKTLTVNMSSMGVSMKLNFKLVEPEGGDEGNDDEGNDDEEGGSEQTSGVSGKAYVFDDIVLVSNTGSYTQSEVKEIIAASRENLTGAHFVFEKGGRLLAVKDGEALAGTWTQSDTTVTAVIEGEPQDFTLDGNKIYTEISYDGLTLKWAFAYDKDFTFDGEITEGGSGTVTNAGRAYSFKSVTVMKNNSNIDDSTLIKEMEKSIQNSHFIFKDGGELVAVNQNIAMAGTWTQKGDTITAVLDGDSQDFTIDGDDIYAIADIGELVLKMTYTYDKDYTFDGEITEGGSGTVEPSKPVTGVVVSGEYRVYDCKVLDDVANAENISKTLLAEYEGTGFSFNPSEDAYGGGKILGGDYDGEDFKYQVENDGNDNIFIHVFSNEAVVFTYGGDYLFSEELYSEEYNVNFYLIYRLN